VAGYASYKVANSVTSHEAYGLGVYAVFGNTGGATISCFNAIETPTNQQVNVHHMMDVCITGSGGSSTITHIINGTGSSVGPSFGTAYANYLWQNPLFSASSSLDSTGTNVAIIFPSESWHYYQVQYKNDLTDPTWSSLGSSVGGNDSLQTVLDPASAPNRFYRVYSH
jgi:hypothetical protein